MTCGGGDGVVASPPSTPHRSQQHGDQVIGLVLYNVPAQQGQLAGGVAQDTATNGGLDVTVQ